MDLAELSLDQKIAQMLLAAYRTHENGMAMARAGAGGIWPIGIPSDQAEPFRRIMRELQSQADVPLLICTDFETGCGQRITDGNCTEFPSMMAFGALADGEAEDLAYRAGCVVAEEAAWLGVQTTPSPVFDVNTVPENPISNTRSVGEDPRRVARIALAYTKGMMSRSRLLPQAKHFPGEGCQRQDPHHGLEVIDVPLEEMERVHLHPFAEAIRGGVPAMMTNHAIYPAFDPDFPATLSRKIMTDLLRRKMGFDGLLVTDAMEMHGITNRFGPEEAVILAVDAGNDLILEPPEGHRFVEWVRKAIKKGRIETATIDAAVGRILRAKARIGLFENALDMPEPTTPIEQRRQLAVEIAEKSITLIRDEAKLIPVDPGRVGRALVLEPRHPGHTLEWGLQFSIFGLLEFAGKYHSRCEHALFDAQPADEQIAALAAKARGADLVLVSTFFRSLAGQTGLLTSRQVALLRQVAAAAKHTICVTSNPYVVAELPSIGTHLACYGTNKTSVAAAVDAVFGRLRPQGRVPVTIPDHIDPSKVEIIAHD